MKWSTTVLVSLVLCSNVFAMSGKAVTALSYHDPAGYPDFWTSRLIVATIADNVVTGIDTIVPAGARGTTMTSPTLSPDGKRIAFFRRGEGLSVVDIDGNNLRTIGGGGAGLGGSFIAWTSLDDGRRIYYHRGSGEIWSVNVDNTSQNAMVCDYTKGSANFMNFSLSTDAGYCVIRALGASFEALGYQGGGWAHTFPPRVNPNTGWIDPALTEVQGSDIQNECNQGVSVSGKLFWHFSGSHTNLYGDLWDHETNTAQHCNPHALFNMYTNVETWLKPSPVMAYPGMGDYLLAPRGASNSDRVITILATWGMVQYNTDGANLLVVNWLDGAAVMVTSNPDQRTGSYKWTAEPGDFHLDGGPANTYQELDGTWVPFPIASSARRGTGNARSAASTTTGSGCAVLYDLRGMRVGAVDARFPAAHRGASCTILPGAYVVLGQGAVDRVTILDGRSRMR